MRVIDTVKIVYEFVDRLILEEEIFWRYLYKLPIHLPHPLTWHIVRRVMRRKRRWVGKLDPTLIYLKKSPVPSGIKYIPESKRWVGVAHGGLD